MFVIVAFAIGVLTLTAVSMATMPIEGVYDRNRSDILRNDMAAIVNAIEERYEENPSGGYLSPAQVIAIPGNEHLRSRGPERFQFETAQALNDGVWRFMRQAVWFESPYDHIGNTAYLSAANNTCGTGSFTSSSSWCGRVQSIWGKLESKGNHSALILAEKQRLYRTISKFYQRYNKDGSFSQLANGQVTTLAQLAGYTGSASSCAGVFAYNEIPLGCNDLFNYWGVPVVFNKVTDTHIALVNRTLLIGSSGQPVRIAEEARLE
ncbi:hypothetical protein [Stutzerimonas stutzeri]|uniref:hypothetical protein n=1 Tax=Stutzerimonas stutzeri TaxID=316 RepID=UPI0015E36F9C|nr:hypothetical protein [Stutzerimonas stutzeri]MBA1280206.1 hypothetical protein [Stutzerimonas stutzeri]